MSDDATDHAVRGSAVRGDRVPPAVPPPPAAPAPGPTPLIAAGPIPRPTIAFDRREADRDRLLGLLALPAVCLLAALPLPGTVGTALLVVLAVTAPALITALVWVMAPAPSSLRVLGDGTVEVVGGHGAAVLRGGPGATVAGEPTRRLTLTDADGETLRLRAHVHDTLGLVPLLAERGWAVDGQPTVTTDGEPPSEVSWEADELPRPLAIDVLRIAALLFVPAALYRLGVGDPVGAVLVAALAAAGPVAAVLRWRRQQGRVDTQQLRITPSAIDVAREDGIGAHLPTGRLVAINVVGLLGSRLVYVEWCTSTAVAATLMLPREEAIVLGDLLATHGHLVSVTPEWPRPLMELYDRSVELLNS